jgi:hypothetical protein
MSYLEPGKLYKINKLFWFLYPTKGTGATADDAVLTRRVAVAARGVAARGAAAAAMASYWSERLNCNVSFLNKEDTIMVVEVSGIQVKVINQEGKSGWINFPETEEWVKGTIVEVYIGH